ncbi:MAG: RNA polymerase sigma factor FliA [Epsilonproteobacteria bacterium]|nr:RNA polymerase sigma factor FliA [Campylobacterota bacterium]OIO15802.1 MAG: RNA polymerase sigma factor FliA [Helicobacteraceae bacterium CG1_02_36_14]PIP09894.1 MAG: RNA polymerase sigma factor FliA [Sulfurimonas sp. CG23_combo_of_CG06-09_8_20_14_all_36_33]PIS24110.1 MAG: RNA polymerase sigma factor FliA [Sulfurimonas sp. CG08_land_8_20_14_0_20_36_33]PIU35594.1 MAG: RNA polymerase sigma factor FliA [Sulfurimonas sp. CG07_land_8_20_14_0_80_36_56]PIV05515.1 MAG: RNA polymerase sigma factor 
MSASAYVNGMKHKEDELAIQYLPAVKAMAYRLKERLPSSIDFLDLSAIGTEELIKLARRYDETLNDSFWGYAKKRVYGAMLDYLRSLDILSRASRKLVKAIDYAVEEYILLHDEEPTDEELSVLLNESVEKVHEARIASSIYTVMPLHDQLHVGDEGAALIQVEKDELIEVIKSILNSYNEREQLIIQFYYFEELTLKEISEILNITESRISQIHKSVLQKIKESVGA